MMFDGMAERQAKKLERVELAVTLRGLGFTWREIGRELKITQAGACAMVKRERWRIGHKSNLPAHALSCLQALQCPTTTSA